MSLTEWVAAAFNGQGLPAKRKRRTRVSVLVERSEQRCLLSAVGSELLATTAPWEGPSFPGGGGGKQGRQGNMNPLDSIPELHSRPGAPVTIYLDFDGHTETEDWPDIRTDGNAGQPVVTPVFDIDNDFTTFSDEELRLIEEVWLRTSEDFSPFNVNVTTVDPGSYNNFETILVSIGGDGSWIGSPGGIAFVNSFNNSASNTVYTFSDNTGLGNSIHAKGMALTSSHEAGHAFGLLHHSVYDANGNKTAEYDPGNADIGPIMGAPYFSTRETWSNAADSNGPNSLQDDMAVMTRAANQTMRFRQDDHGNTFATATEIPITQPDFTTNGVIEIAGDVDMFSFETDAGPITLNATGLDVNDYFGLTGLRPGTNADLVLRLYNESGTLLFTDDPGSSLSASISIDVPAGKYFVAVTTPGDYFSTGQYTLSGTVIPLPVVPTMIAPTGTLDQPVPTFEWSTAGAAESYDLEVDNLSTGQSRFYTRNVPGTLHTAVNQFPQGEYQARVRSVTDEGSVSAWSEYIEFSIDIPAPAKPSLTRPVGEVSTSFPTFAWQDVDYAAGYSLWVNDFNTGQRVIYRTNYTGLEYTHFDPLVDGTYRAWVRATNSVGESSPWSDFVEFTIDVPAPTKTKITAPATPTTNVNPRIVWDSVEGAFRYDLWVDYRTGGTAQYLREQNIRGQNYFDPPGLPQGNFTAWVRAANANGEVGPWSDTYSFAVDILPPDRPTMTGPVGPNGSRTITSANPEFTWTEVERATHYDLWVNNDTTGQVQIIRQKTLGTNSYTATNNLPQGNYRAWVRGVNSAGEVGTWSSAYSFTVDDPIPSVPVITAPQPNTAGAVEDDTPTIAWTGEVAGEYYDVWIDNNSLNEAQFIRQQDVTDEQWTVPDNMRLEEHVFTVWVRAANVADEFSDWSEPYRFRIDVPNPTTPTIIAPGGTINDTTPTFEWTHARGSVKYEILVRDLDRQENIVLNVTTFQVSPDGTRASYEVPAGQALQKGTYRFWIRAFNSQGHSSSWSASRSFVIAAMTVPESDLLFEDGSIDAPVLTRRPAEPIPPRSEASAVKTATERFIAGDLPTTTESVHRAVPVEDVSVEELDRCCEVIMGELADPQRTPATGRTEAEESSSARDVLTVAAALGLAPMTTQRGISRKGRRH